MALTQAQIQQQVLAAGYNGPLTDAAINQAYANAATPADLASSGLSNTQFTQPTTPTTNPASQVTDPLSQLAAFAQATSGTTQAQLSQQKQEFEEQLQFARDQMTQLGIPQLQINQFLAQMQQQQFQSQLALTQQAQAFSQAATAAQLTGYYNAPQAVPDVSQYMQPGQPSLTNPLGTGTSQMDRNLYVNDRISQLQGLGYSQDQARQTAQAEYDQGFAQSGSVAYGMPSGFSFNTAGNAAPPSSIGSWKMPTQQNYVAARVQQLIGQGYDGQKAAETANAEATMYWPQVQQGQVAYGLPQGISFTPPTGTAGGTTSAGTGTGGTGGATADITGGGATTQQGIPTLANILQQATLSGMFNGAPTEAAREFNQNLALQQGQLGQQYLSTAAQLQGPQNTFQLSNYLRGAQGNQNVPTYLQNLANNIGMPTFQATGSTAPTPQTAAGLAGQLGGTTSATPGWDYNQTLGSIQRIMSQGAQSMRPGALEGLSPDELQAFGSGLGAVGGSLPSFLQQYQASRVGQQAGSGVTSFG